MQVQIHKANHHYLQSNIELNWTSLLFYFEELANREIDSSQALMKWLTDRSELEAFLEEEFAWRYIHMTSDTANEEFSNAFKFFAEEIEPQMAPWNDILNKKLMGNSWIQEIQDPDFNLFFKKIHTQIKLFREENIPIQTSLQLKQQEYGRICGAMSVVIQGETLTLEQASTLLKSQDRNLRKQAFEKIAERRLQDKEVLDNLFSELVGLRQTLAKNTGHKNFRDYSFEALGRFDYGPEETKQFQEAIRAEIVPILAKMAEKRKIKLGLEELRPWDMEVDISGKPPLKPFHSADELIDKTILCFGKLDPYFGSCLEAMKSKGLFDLESRQSKAPGGYNYPLAESGAPFIFMNSAGAFRDLATMVHEGGHAIHTFLSRDLLVNDFKHLTSEIAELASMSMELISMKYWDIFFPEAEDLKRARMDQLADVLKTFPWVAIVDKFQDQLYTQPFSIKNTKILWNQIYQEFGGGFCDWTGYEDYRDHLWQKQLHIFEVPFYYIEYGIAGLGAIAIWKNFTENPIRAVEAYRNALSLGYTKSIPQIYETAGIRFDMSSPYIAGLAEFVQEQIVAMDK